MKHLKLFLFVTSIVVFASCKDKEPTKCPEDTYHNLADIEKARIPYNGKDTLVFVSNTGDTAVLYGQGKEQHYEQDAWLGGDADRGCPAITNYFEAVDISFKGYHAELNSLYLLYDLAIDIYVYQSFLEIDVLQKQAIGRPYIVNDINNYTDSITYLGKVIYGINIGVNSNSDSAFVLYNYNYGVLRIKETNSKIWTLTN